MKRQKFVRRVLLEIFHKKAAEKKRLLLFSGKPVWPSSGRWFTTAARFCWGRCATVRRDTTCPQCWWRSPPPSSTRRCTARFHHPPAQEHVSGHVFTSAPFLSLGWWRRSPAGSADHQGSGGQRWRCFPWPAGPTRGHQQGVDLGRTDLWWWERGWSQTWKGERPQVNIALIQRELCIW